jgi:cytochrome oxidase complex assembly protein 1
MTTKKILIIVGAVVLVIGLIVVVFVGGIIGIAFYSVGRSEAAESARYFLRTNERLKQEIGEIRDFGRFVTGSININNNNGNATINLKVIGERQTVNASVDLVYKNGQPWRVIAASYQNDKGQTIELLNPYEGRIFLQQLILKAAA